MIAVIAGPEYWKDISEFIQKTDQEVVYKRIDVDIDIDSEIDKLSIYPIQFLILDMNCIGNIKRIPPAVKRLKSSNEDVRLLIIAAGRFAGNEIVASLVSLGVYDIIGQKDYGKKSILPLLLEHFKNPATYAKAVKWDDSLKDKSKPGDPLELGQESGKAKTVKDKIIGTMVIAVAGAIHRIGTTHAALSIAKYLYDSNFGVAVYEFHNSDTFQSIQRSYEEIEIKDDMFSLAGIDFYPFDAYRSVADLLHGDYAYIVLDMGVYSECSISEFRRAHEKIIVSGVKDWEIGPTEDILKDSEWAFKYKYLFNFSDEESFAFIKKNMVKVPSYRAAYNPNPLDVTPECDSVYDDMLKSVLPQTQLIDDKSGAMKKVIKKMIDRDDTLYHSTVLQKKLLEESREKGRKSAVDNLIKTRRSPLRLAVKVVAAALLLTGAYYLLNRFGIFDKAGELFKQIKEAFLL
ncbi:MAG TPA: hypothetical protein VHT96_18490 [Clostridia bacterium]|nr:hypothetical protein [Clostridia bacterium]